ncbi:hypothetical protein D5086_027789 [Populus alba]|uniref:Uncharacterized protein n=1 Tax=Populus alba TaxID=43335 RepID=A0ACC4AWQ6_POPAL
MGNYNYFWPEDIIREILSRLSVQSLLRFKTVSKIWFDVITSSNFIDSHYQHPSKPKLFVMLTQRRELYSISVLPGGINRVDDRSMPFALEAATRQHRELPPNRICYSQAQGFGFHHGSWRKVEDTLPSYDYGIAKPVVVKGVWYHMATAARETPFIIRFDMGDDTFSKVKTAPIPYHSSPEYLVKKSVPISDVGLLPLGFWVDEERIISENYKRDGLSLFNLSTKQSKVVVVDEARRFGSAHS